MTDPLVDAANAISDKSPAIKRFAGLAAQRIIALGTPPSPPPSPPPSSGLVLKFDGNPNTRDDLTPWDFYNAGAGNVEVAKNPHGTTTPGGVHIADDPLGQRGYVYALTTNQTAQASPAAGTDSVFLYEGIKDWYGLPGKRSRVRFGVLFDSRTFHAEPLGIGGLTWLYEDHNGGPMPSPYSSVVMGIVTDHRVSDGSVRAQLFVRYAGGDTRNPQAPVYKFSNVALRLDAWCDVELEVLRSPVSGAVRLAVSGGLAWEDTYTGPTLWTDGSQYDRPNFELANYRPTMAEPSTIHFSRLTVEVEA